MLKKHQPTRQQKKRHIMPLLLPNKSGKRDSNAEQREVKRGYL